MQQSRRAILKQNPRAYRLWLGLVIALGLMTALQTLGLVASLLLLPWADANISLPFLAVVIIPTTVIYGSMVAGTIGAIRLTGWTRVMLGINLVLSLALVILVPTVGQATMSERLAFLRSESVGLVIDAVFFAVYWYVWREFKVLSTATTS